MHVTGPPVRHGDSLHLFMKKTFAVYIPMWISQVYVSGISNKKSFFFCFYWSIQKNTFDTCKMVISCCFEWVWHILLNGKWMDVKLSTGLLFHKRIVLSEIAFFFFKTCVLTRYFFYIFMWLQCMWMFHKYLVKIQVDKKKNVPS